MKNVTKLALTALFGFAMLTTTIDAGSINKGQKIYGKKIKTVSFIWMQGEQDSKNALSAEAYSDNLSLLYSRVGEDIGDSTFDLTFGKVLPDAPGFDNTRLGSRDAIREDMEEADEGSGHPDAIAGATLMA